MNNRLKTYLKWIIGIPISLTVCAFFVFLLLQMEMRARIYSMLALFALGILVLVLKVVQSQKQEKIVTNLLHILYKKADPARFIAETKAQIEKTKNKSLLGTLYLNLAVGYEAIGDFGMAIDTMKKSMHLMTDKLSTAIFYINMAAFYAQNGTADSGLEAYQLGRPHVEKCKKMIPAANLLFVRGLLFYAEGKYEDALDSFRKVQPNTFEDRHSGTKLKLYEARTLVKLGQIKEAKAIYGRICQHNTYPYLLECARQEQKVLHETT